MGIPRFFYWLYKEYPYVLTKIQEKETLLKYRMNVDTYALDLNAIVHPICQQVFKYGQFKEKDNSFRSYMHKNRNNKFNNKKEEKTDNIYANKRVECYNKICEKIEELVEIVNPNQKIILALDGTAGMSKQYQQRQRRYRAVIENPVDHDNEKEFDSNEITTGSVFMNELSQCINEFIKHKITDDWKHLDIYFSSEQVPGEGEHKIMHLLKRYGSYSSYCIHSPDADLIMLSLASLCTENYKKCYIMRDNIYQHVLCKYFVVDVNLFSDIIINKFKNLSNLPHKNNTLYLSDFILYCFFFGNDFLPENPLMLTNKNGIDILFMLYSETLANIGNLTNTINNKVTLNLDQCIYFFKMLAENEQALFDNKYKDEKCKNKYNDINSEYITTKEIIDCDNYNDTNNKDKENENENKNDVEIFKKIYYKNKLEFDVDNPVKYKKQLYKLCNEYMRGIQFVLTYYLYDIPDWYWFYPYHYAPLFSDIHNYLEVQKKKRKANNTVNANVLSYKFEKNEPLTPYEQLLAVLPPESSKILPESFSKLMKSDSVIKEFYPNTNNIKIEIKSEYEKTILVPFIDVKKLREEFHKQYLSHKNTLSKEEIDRNCFIDNKIYINTNKYK